jgi:cysteine dioxygenase
LHRIIVTQQFRSYQPGGPPNLSTHVEPLTNVASEPESKFTPSSLADLVAALTAQQTLPSLEQLDAWLENSAIDREDLLPYIGFKEGNYWRHRVMRNDFVEMLVLCWRPGQRTPIHDHNGSQGAVLVYEGLMWETTFNFKPDSGLAYKSGQEYSAGEVTGAAVPDIHQLGNPDVSGQDLITIHIYSPPLGVLKTYKVGSPDIDLYTPNDFPT